MDDYSYILNVAVIILGGYLMGRLCRRLTIPMVVGYVVAGIILGPSLLGVVTPGLSETLEIVKILGLGMIALVIGGQLALKQIRDLGKIIAGISVGQLSITFLLVFMTMYLILKLPLTVSLLLGALSTATAPASQLAVIREYGARGKFTNTLLGVVALQNAGCIILFGLVSAVVALLVEGSAVTSGGIFSSLGEVFLSVLLGVISGLLLVLLLPRITDRKHKVTLLLGYILLNSGAAYALDLSPLLVNMACGFIVANIYVRPEELNVLEEIEMPVILLFFALAGASLQLEMIWNNWSLVVVYIAARGIGLFGGTYFGALATGADKLVRTRLGFSMMPKAGLTIGLLMLVQYRFPELALIIVSVELAAVAICELLGPFGTRYALISSGETSAHTQV